VGIAMYTVTVTNPSATTAFDVEISDVVGTCLQNLTVINATSSGGATPPTGTNPVKVQRIPPNGSVVVTYAGRRAQASLAGYFVGRRDDSTFLTDEFFGFSMLLPTAYDYSTLTATNSLVNYSLTPTGREVDAELSYGSSVLGDSGWVGGNLFLRRQPGHIATANTDYGAAIRFTLGF